MALQQGSSWFRRQAAPITIGIVASLVIFAFGWLFLQAKGVEQFVLSPTWQSKPWTLFTYPWADVPFASGGKLLGFVFLCIWIFFMGGSSERDLGPSKYAVLWLTMVLLPALFIVLLGPSVGIVAAAGMWLPSAGVTLVWCVRNPTSQIMLYGLIPLSGKWLGWITIAATILLSGRGNPLFGVISGLHLAVAWAFAANRIPFRTYSRGGGTFGKAKLADRPFLKKADRMDKSYYDDVKKREKDRDERERLRKMFESSVNDDPPKDR